MRRWRRNTKQGDVGERKNDITLGDLIADVRRQLSDKGIRIAEDPVPFQLAWWLTSPTAMEQHVQELHSEYGQPSGPKTLNEEFFAEVRAIQDVLKNSSPLTKTGDELVDAGNEVEGGMNRRARAMSLWEQIAFPLRRYGDIIFRVRAPAPFPETLSSKQRSQMTSLGASRRTRPRIKSKLPDCKNA